MVFGLGMRIEDSGSTISNNESLVPDATNLRRGPRLGVGTWGGGGTSGPWCRRGGGGH